MDPDPRRVPHLARGLTWREQPEGFAFRTAARTVTAADLSGFVALAGFNGPMFLDVRRAAEAGYTSQVVPGFLTLVLAEGLVLQTNVLHGTGIAFLGCTVEVARPVYVGDTIEVVVTVTGSRPTSTGDRGIVSTRNTVYNQDHEVVLVYTPQRMQRGEHLDEG